jgi:hypothetical protein
VEKGSIAGALAVQALLLAALLPVVLSALRKIRTFERFAPPVGARRVHFNREIGESFPIDLLPSDLVPQVSSGEALFLFAGPHCGICPAILPSLAGFSRSFPQVQFIVCSAEPWKDLERKVPRRVRTIESRPLFAHLGVSMQPYAIRIVDGIIVEYGVINIPEHLESVLLSRIASLRGAAGA